MSCVVCVRKTKYFSHYLIKKKLLNTKCVFWFCRQLLSQTLLILRRHDQKCTMIFKYSTRYSCQDINETWIFSTYFRKILKYQISWKSVQWEPSSSTQTEEQTDMTKLIVTFGNCVNAPKNLNSCQDGKGATFHKPEQKC